MKNIFTKWIVLAALIWLNAGNVNAQLLIDFDNTLPGSVASRYGTYTWPQHWIVWGDLVINDDVSPYADNINSVNDPDDPSNKVAKFSTASGSGTGTNIPIGTTYDRNDYTGFTMKVKSSVAGLSLFYGIGNNPGGGVADSKDEYYPSSAPTVTNSNTWETLTFPFRDDGSFLFDRILITPLQAGSFYIDDITLIAKEGTPPPPETNNVLLFDFDNNYPVPPWPWSSTYSGGGYTVKINAKNASWQDYTYPDPDDASNLLARIDVLDLASTPYFIVPMDASYERSHYTGLSMKVKGNTDALVFIYKLENESEQVGNWTTFPAYTGSGEWQTLNFPFINTMGDITFNRIVFEITSHAQNPLPVTFTFYIDDITLIPRTSPALTWIGTTQNGLTPANWAITGNLSDIGYVPSTATDITIPKMSSKIYPEVPAGGATVNSVTFEAGAEIKNQHLLTYTDAAVKYDLTPGRWHMITTPFETTAGSFHLKSSPHSLTRDAWLQKFKSKGNGAFWDYYPSLSQGIPIGEGFAYWIQKFGGDIKSMLL